MRVQHDISGGDQRQLHELNVRIAQGETEGLDGLAACLLPFLSAIDWRGGPRQVAEALPHAATEIDLVDFRNILCRLGLTVHTVRNALADGWRHYWPCAFIPDGDAPVVVMGENEGRLWLYDSAIDDYREIDEDDVEAERLGTLIFLPRDNEDAPADDAAPTTDWIVATALRFRRLALVAFGLTFFMTLLSLVSPLGIMALYVAVLPYESGAMIPFIAGAVIACLLAEGGLRHVRAEIHAYIVGRVDYIVSTGTFEHVLRMPANMTTTATVGDQAARLRSFQVVRDFVASPMTPVMLELPFLPVYIAVIWLLAGPVAFVPIAALAVYLLVGLLMQRGVKRKTDLAGQIRSERHAFIVEMLRQMSAIKQLGAEDIWRARFRAISGKSAAAGFDAARASLSVQDMSHVVMVTSGIATMALVVVGVIAGETHAGALLAIMALTWRVLSPIQGGLKFISQLEKVATTFRQLNALMRVPQEKSGDGSVLDRRIAEGAIKCQNVSLKFGQTTHPALLGVNFVMEPGEFAVIVGSSGSGKSTLVKILLRLNDPMAGAVFIDGIDIRQMPPPVLRRSIGYAPQYPRLMYGTIAQNLRLYEPSATQAELEAVCDEIGILDAIRSLPEGFDSRYGDQTIGQLPHGFLNMLSIGAALLREPAILLLDEAHDGLDSHYEAKLLKRLEKLRGKTTVLMVTHRPSHMRMADRVLALEDGRLIHDGPPDEVLPKMQGPQANPNGGKSG